MKRYSKKVNILTTSCRFGKFPKKYKNVTILDAGFKHEADGVFAYIELDIEDDVCAEEILKHIEAEKGFHFYL